MGHQNQGSFGARRQIHRATDPHGSTAGDRPVGQITGLRYLHRPQNRDIHMPTPNHREGRSGVKGRTPGHNRDRLLARVDNLGVLFVRQGKLDEAEREMTLGQGGEARDLSDPLTGRLQGFKTGYHARISEAVSYVAAGKPFLAIEKLEPLLLSHPDDEALLNNLAVAYTHTQQFAKARIELLKVIEIEPTSFPAPSLTRPFAADAQNWR